MTKLLMSKLSSKSSKVKKQQLFYDDKEMENDKKISDYSIPNEATLNLFENRNIYSEITIKPPIGRPLEIEITRSTTIKRNQR